MSEKQALPQEVLIRLFVNGNIISHLLCTPAMLKELAVGWLFGQGMIDGINEINALGVCDNGRDISAQVAGQDGESMTRYHPVTTSGCSGGQIGVDAYLEDLASVASSLRVELAGLPQLMSAMFRRLDDERPSAGLHCAALACGEEMKVEHLAWDVGRHNAVDKVIGAGLLSGIKFDNCVIATSGRISSDMALKTARAGIPIVATQRSVTTMAADIADATGIAIVGRLNKPDRLIVDKCERIIQ